MGRGCLCSEGRIVPTTDAGDKYGKDETYRGNRESVANHPEPKGFQASPEADAVALDLYRKFFAKFLSLYGVNSRVSEILGEELNALYDVKEPPERY